MEYNNLSLHKFTDIPPILTVQLILNQLLKIQLTFFDLVILWFLSVSLVIAEGNSKSTGRDIGVGVPKKIIKY